MKIAVIGSRNFQDYSILKLELDKISGITELVSGGATGADTLARKYAQENNIPLKEFNVNYQMGSKAPHIRNDQIIKYCDFLIAFWDGHSKGTQSVIRKAVQAKKLLAVYHI